MTAADLAEFPRERSWPGPAAEVPPGRPGLPGGGPAVRAGAAPFPRDRPAGPLTRADRRDRAGQGLVDPPVTGDGGVSAPAGSGRELLAPPWPPVPASAPAPPPTGSGVAGSGRRSTGADPAEGVPVRAVAPPVGAGGGVLDGAGTDGTADGTPVGTADGTPGGTGASDGAAPCDGAAPVPGAGVVGRASGSGDGRGSSNGVRALTRSATVSCIAGGSAAAVPATRTDAAAAATAPPVRAAHRRVGVVRRRRGVTVGSKPWSRRSASAALGRGAGRSPSVRSRVIA